MSDKDLLHILTINGGSSSLKLALYAMGKAETLMISGRIERIGLRAARFRMTGATGETLVDEQLDLPDHNAALKALFDWLRSHALHRDLDAVGHRLVHGGPRFVQPHWITAELITALKELIPLAPDHLPHELKAIQAVSRLYPNLEQVACFDTAFHRKMPRLAQLYALPRPVVEDVVIRYGFHGLSYEYIINELAGEAGRREADGRVIIAHLGNGASMAAVSGGTCLDTTMGFTPTGGLVMSTRSGDLDPGVILYFLEEKGWRPSFVNDLLNRHAGLLGLSGLSADMKTLLEKRTGDPQAAEAVDLFCYQARKFLAGLTAVLGGVDTLVFTGGIGENAPPIRRSICKHLGYLGIYLDDRRNQENAPVISRDDSRVAVRVMPTNEELMIARHVKNLMGRNKK